jgi:hypothetical protein
MGLSEEEQVMEIVTSWMEKGIEQGIQQVLEREIKLVLQLINRYIGAIPADFERNIRSLSLVEVELLMEALFEIKSEENLENWLEQRGLRQEVESSVLSQLNRRFGTVSLDLEKQVRSLPIERVEELAASLFDFEGEEAMMNWLNEVSEG